ncbi:MAG: DNA repair protein RecN [Bacteroidota bacterium]
MLQHLSVENYALIDKLEIDFEDGFSIITGETGAGKSILLGALGLILGQRADSQVLSDKSRKCIIEGVFLIKDYNLDDFFAENDLDAGDTAILRREITPEGKSRAFINDTPVNLNILKEISDRLVDIHSQHKNLSVNEHSFQLSVIDGFVGHNALLKKYKAEYNTLMNFQRQMQELEKKELQARTDQDYFRFLFDELDNAALKENEQENLEAEQAVLSHAETISITLSKVTNAFSGDDLNLLGTLAETINQLDQVARYHADIAALTDRLKTTYIEIKDIAGETAALEDKIQHDPARMETVNARLDLLYRLQHKHRVSTVNELLTLKNELDDKLLAIVSLETQIAELRGTIENQTESCTGIASKLSEARKKAIPQMEKKLAAVLKLLGMPDAQLKIAHEISTSLKPEGFDHITFLFTANKGMEPKGLSKVASGGELSRLMLAVKSLVSQRSLLPTIIFDEIDSGVSGETAGKVGKILSGMADFMQVVAITHLPQIAGMGKNHYFVYKKNEGGLTRSYIRKLTESEREQEIAQMLSGENYSDAALKTARELLSTK